MVLVVVAAAVAALLNPVGAHAKPPNPRANPKTNTAPSQSFIQACAFMSTTKASNDSCDKAALVDFDKVRHQEGLGRMVLPHDFDRLGVPSQLMAITNIERVDRGLPAFAGRSGALDKLAQGGANHDTDASFPPYTPGEWDGGAWAGGANSALLSDFEWVYDDGLGSGNIDCTPTNKGGCWGHRDSLLNDHYTAPLVMGAAVAYNTKFGTSMAEVLIGDDHSEKVDRSPIWRTIAATMPVGLSAAKLTVVTHNAKRGHATVKVRAYVSTKITAKLHSGTKYWSVSPKSCRLAAGHACTLHLSFHSKHRGTHHATLRVSGPVATRSVKLISHRR